MFFGDAFRFGGYCLPVRNSRALVHKSLYHVVPVRVSQLFVLSSKVPLLNFLRNYLDIFNGEKNGRHFIENN